MKSLCRTCLLLVLIALSAGPVSACLWDRDTLAMERERFPDVIELITGKFLRHSRYYYEWRVKQGEAIVAGGEFEAAVLDDLAVAYEKLGNHDKAIETIQKKEELFPGLYETYANLGTFYIHNGEFEKGLKEIERAIKINPEAHFGREVYQKLLVEYVLSKQEGGKTKLPLQEEPWGGFADFVLKKQGIPEEPEDERDELEKARKGVLGMMRFGNHDSPVPLEALANLLLFGNGGDRDDAKRLAACALLKASYEAEDEETRKAYREQAELALIWQRKNLESEGQLTLEEIEEVFLKQVAEASGWFGEVEADEVTWIESGKNPDEEFAKKYDEEPRLSTKFEGPKMTTFQKKWGIPPRPALITAILVGVILSGVVFVFVRLLKNTAKKYKDGVVDLEEPQ